MLRLRSFVLGVLALGLTACPPPRTGGGATAKAPDFVLPDVNGQQVRLSDHLGKDVVLVTFWATWCDPCKGEFPHLQRFYEKYGSKGFVVLAVSMDDSQSVANVGPLANRLGITFPVLLDTEGKAVGLYNPTRAAPFAVLIARDGAIAIRREGYAPGDEAALEKDIAGLLEAQATP